MTEKGLILGVDISEECLQISCYQKNQEELIKDCLFLSEEEKQQEEQGILLKIQGFLREQQLLEEKIEQLVFSFFPQVQGKIKRLKTALDQAGFLESQVKIISRENAFVHYVMQQESSLRDHTVLLFDFDGQELYAYRLEHSKKKSPKQFRVEASSIGSFTLLGENKDRGRIFDEHFSSISRQLLSKEVVSAVFLTGKGFEGGWLNRSLNVLCSGRRAFIGQNLFSGGCCYYGIEKAMKKESGYIVCAPEMVLYESGVVDGGKEERFVPITKSGQAWYETKGSVELIPERSGRVDIVFNNIMTEEKQVESVDVSGLPLRPRKTGRLHVEVQFLGSHEGIITVRDMGFGAFSPATHQVFLKEFKLL